MKSIKPGRGPSAMSAFASILVAVVGICWTFYARSIGAPAIFTLFGIVFVAVAIAGAVSNLLNATRKNRFSSFDITDEKEEPDPLNQVFHPESSSAPADDSKARFCPYCGAELIDPAARFCQNCGKELPQKH